MHIEDSPSFRPDLLRAAATEAQLTQQAIATRMGMSMRAVQKWFLGESAPSGARLIALARLLDRDPAWFYTERDESEAA